MEGGGLCGENAYGRKACSQAKIIREKPTVPSKDHVMPGIPLSFASCVPGSPVKNLSNENRNLQ